MYKKIVGIIICTLLIFTTTSLALTTLDKDLMQMKNNYFNNTVDNFIVDQMQPFAATGGESVDESSSCAQSFKPSVSLLAKIDLFCSKREVHGRLREPLIISIRTDLKGENLSQKMIPSYEVSDFPGSWLEIDIPDIELIPEETYYIVAESYCEVSQPDGYSVHLIWRTVDGYNRGEAWVAYNSNSGMKWSARGLPSKPNSDKYYDLAFRTYTYGENNPPETPTIEGPINGTVDEYIYFDVVSTDPDGDDLFYTVDYDYYIHIYTYGPYPSGEKKTHSFKWGEAGTYTVRVKAEDVNSAESDWASFEIVITKSKQISLEILLQNLIQRFPWFEEILNQII